ncbi:MAG TPA: OadG family protein [Clostridiaceae bacterium]|nr:OadG family protein [Clostridiaceae bacterium]
MLRFCASASADRPSDPSIILIAIIGFAAVFIVLMLFWLIISLMQKAANKNDFSKKSEQKEALLSVSPKENVLENSSLRTVSYAYGQCDLHNVDDRTATLLIAIVADKMQAPLNELYFKSIRPLESEQK